MPSAYLFGRPHGITAPAAGRGFSTHRSDGHDGERRRDFRAMAQRAGETRRSAGGHRRPGEFRGAAEVFGNGRKTLPRAQAVATSLRCRKTRQLNLPHRNWVLRFHRSKITAASNPELPTEHCELAFPSKWLRASATWQQPRRPPPEPEPGHGDRSKHSANSPSA